jgi:CheY-like chemotaxis protein
VEDNKINQVVTVQFLGKLGYRANVAAKPPEYRSAATYPEQNRITLRAS